MSRRGQCRCGLVLTFHRKPHGYKMRCPSCGSVVRLRVRKRHRKPATVQNELLEALAAEGPSADDFDVELMPSSKARARPRGNNAAIVAVAVTAGVVSLAVVAGLTWWLLG